MSDGGVELLNNCLLLCNDGGVCFYSDAGIRAASCYSPVFGDHTRWVAEISYGFSMVVITFILIYGLRILMKVMLSTDPDNPKLRFIDKAMLEKGGSRRDDVSQTQMYSMIKLVDTLTDRLIADPKVLKAPTVTPQKPAETPERVTATAPASDKDESLPSTSRIVAFFGALVVGVMVLGFGYYIIWSLYNGQEPKLSSFQTFLISSAALFMPYGFNRLFSLKEK